MKIKSSSVILTTTPVPSLPCCPSPVLPSYHQDQAHTAVGDGSGPEGCGRDAPGPSRGSGGEGRWEAGADSRSLVGSRSPQSTGPATRPGWRKQCCSTQNIKDINSKINMNLTSDWHLPQAAGLNINPSISDIHSSHEGCRGGRGNPSWHLARGRHSVAGRNWSTMLPLNIIARYIL